MLAKTQSDWRDGSTSEKDFDDDGNRDDKTFVKATEDANEQSDDVDQLVSTKDRIFAAARLTLIEIGGVGDVFRP